jgi:hypothetical protein
LDHTAKYGLSALMLALIGGQRKTALDLAIARGHSDMIEILRRAAR